MPARGAADIPHCVERTTKDPEIAAWLETGRVLGGPAPIAAPRRANDAFIDRNKPYAEKFAQAGNDITFVHHPDLPHGFIQMTAQSRRCLEATAQRATLRGAALQA